MINKKWHNVLSDYTRITESVTLDDLQGRYALEWLNAARWQPVRSAFPSDSWASCSRDNIGLRERWMHNFRCPDSTFIHCGRHSSSSSDIDSAWV